MVRRGSRRPRLGLLVGLLVLATTLAGVPTASASSLAPTSCSKARHAGRHGKFLGVLSAHPRRPTCLAAPSAPAAPATEPSYATGGAPPLVFHGGPVMSAPDVGSQVSVTPIFWAPGGGYTFSDSYRSVIDSYLANVAADSGSAGNVFASTTQYAGSNGAISYHLTVGSAILDTTSYPSSGCTVDTGPIYADSSGYGRCLDDDQINAEVTSVVTAHGLPSGLGHMYLMFLPQGVESCFYPAGTASQQCTINSTPSSAYCGYHSSTGPGSTIYSTLPFPVYGSATGDTCTVESFSGGVQAPNGDANADTMVGTASHEMAESITDPLGDAWYDASGYENGDDCAYIYGTLSGTAGRLYNQTINGAHYLTQEEFSNDDFAASRPPCIQVEEAPPPAIAGVAPTTGPSAGGQRVLITGTHLSGATGVTFGGTAATFSVVSDTTIAATAPAHGSGTVDIAVTTPGGTTPTVSLDEYTYVDLPDVTRVSPAAGPTSGGQTVTLTGSRFAGASGVTFGTTAATFQVVDDGTIVATVPAHPVGTVDVSVTTPLGTSVVVPTDHYLYAAAPAVSSISPSSGRVAGGGVVSVTGSGFTGATQVLLGSTPARFTVLSSTHLTVITPTHVAGTVDLRVRTPGGTSSAVASDRYTFRPVPRVTGLSPRSGSRHGGTVVTVTGSGFGGPTRVTFGSTRATSVRVLSATRLTVRAPAHTVGRAGVRVSTTGGTSPLVLVDRFRYR